MLKKHLSIALACHLLIGSLHAEDTPQLFGKEHYKKAGIIASLFASFIGWSAWASRNKMVGRILYDSNGNIVEDTSELFAWLTKVEKNDVTAIKIVSSANIEDTFTIKTTLHPFSETTDFKIMLGIAGITGIYALYCAYKFFATPDKTVEPNSESVA